MLSAASAAQDFLTFSKKSNPEQKFSVRFGQERVLVKPLSDKLQNAVLVEYRDSLLSVRCQPKNRLHLRHNRLRFSQLDLRSLSNEQCDSAYYAMIYSEQKVYHISELKRIIVPMEKRPEREGLLMASHFTVGSFGVAAILSLGSRSPVAVIATYSAFTASVIPELILPEKRIVLREWYMLEP